MKRIIIAVAVIIIAFSIAFTGYFLVDKKCKDLELNLAKICNISQQTNVKKAIDLSDETVELWEDIHDIIESFIRHEETDKLEETIKSLPVYARQGNLERLEQQADLAIDELHHLIRSEKPLLSNIF